MPHQSSPNTCSQMTSPERQLADAATHCSAPSPALPQQAADRAAAGMRALATCRASQRPTAPVASAAPMSRDYGLFDDIARAALRFTRCCFCLQNTVVKSTPFRRQLRDAAHTAFHIRVPQNTSDSARCHAPRCCHGRPLQKLSLLRADSLQA